MESYRPTMAELRKAFLAGLLIMVPLGVTVFVFTLIVRYIDSLQPNIYGSHIPGLGIVLTLSILLLVGWAAQSYLGGRLVRWYEASIARVPVISSVYQGVKQVVEAALAQGSDAVQGVVLVEWPRRGIWSIGFHTGEAWVEPEDGRRMISVFLPSTPNPTTGFYFMVPYEEVVDTDLSLEDAAKVLMSAGIVHPKHPAILPHVTRSRTDTADLSVPEPR